MDKMDTYKDRKRIIDAFNNFLDCKFEYLILDVETTGLNNDDEIVEISIVDMTGTLIFTYLYKPLKPIPENVTAIHGIDNVMVSKAPKWADDWDAIKAIISDKTLLIYNAEYDVRMINQTCIKHGCDTLKLKTYCIMEMYKLYINSSKWIKLQNACKTENISSVQEHRSTGDCLLVLKLIQKIAKFKP